MLAVLFAPFLVTEFEGRVIQKKEDCILVRSDDNVEKWFCGIDAMLQSRIKVTTYDSVTHLLRFYRCAAQEMTVMSEGAETVVDLLNAMTLEEKLGQMMIVRTEENLSEPLDFVPGGYILFGNDFKGKNEEEIIAMTRFLQSQPFGALLMVDEEGGDVNRVSSALYEEGFPSSQELYKEGGWEAVAQNLEEKSALLASLGIQINLNPVADISLNEQDYIHFRTFGKDALLTSQYVSMAVIKQKEAGLMSCLKHFPGYGGNADTHRGFSVDERELGEFRNRDFLPFLSGVQAGAELIMMSHVIMNAVDAEHPASLSLSVHQLLREELMYDGLIISDDLTMAAIKQLGIDPLVEAIRAGNDLILTTDPEVSLSSVIEAAKQGLISMNRIDESVLRILKIKEKYGLLE